MLSAVIFGSEKQLQELTGLPDSTALWEAGFENEDWDIGFQLNERIHSVKPDAGDKESEYGCSYRDLGWLEVTADNQEYWTLLHIINTYAAGPSYTEYKGKHYYLLHHS